MSTVIAVMLTLIVIFGVVFMALMIGKFSHHE